MYGFGVLPGLKGWHSGCVHAVKGAIEAEASISSDSLFRGGGGGGCPRTRIIAFLTASHKCPACKSFEECGAMRDLSCSNCKREVPSTIPKNNSMMVSLLAGRPKTSKLSPKLQNNTLNCKDLGDSFNLISGLEAQE